MLCSSHQSELKQMLCNLRNTHHHTTKPLKPQNLFVGVGSDEAICAPSMFLYSGARQDFGLSSNLWVRTFAAVPRLVLKAICKA